MCVCNPQIRTPWCPKCRPLDLGVDTIHLLTDQPRSDKPEIEVRFEKIKEIVKFMNGMSEEGFTNKYMNDPYFNKSIGILVDLIYNKKHR